MGRVKERARRCAKCGYGWWAVEVKKPKGMGFIASSGAPGFDSAAIANAKAFNRAEASKAWERWALCRRCGSQDINTVGERGFVPTGLADAQAAAVAPAAPSPPSGMQAPAAAVPGRNPDGTWERGSAVVVRALGYRGLRGTVERRGPMGNYTIALDRGGKATSIPGDKLDPA